MRLLLSTLLLSHLIFGSASTFAGETKAIEAEGTVHAMSQIDVRSAEPGKLERIHVQLGERVKAGQLVAEVRADTPQGSELLPLTARMDGVVIGIPAHLGQPLLPQLAEQQGTTLLTIGDLSKLNIGVKIPAALAGSVSRGQTVEVWAAEQGRKPISGEVVFIAPVMTTVEGAKVCQFQIYAPQPTPSLPPGTKVKLVIPSTTSSSSK